MPDLFYSTLLDRTERRLSSPRSVTFHAILFSILTFLAGVSNFLTYGYYIDGGVYWAIFLWCIALAGHAIFAYRRSGLRKSAREKAIQQELLETAAHYEVSTEELVDLHERLSHDIELRARPLAWTLASALGNVSMWQGMLLVAIFINNVAPMSLSITGFETFAQGIPFVGTTVIGFVLMLAAFFGRRSTEEGELRNATLRALYSPKIDKYKRGERLAIDDEGELVLSEALERRKQR